MLSILETVLFENILRSSTPPPVESFFLLTNNGDSILTNNGDRVEINGR